MRFGSFGYRSLEVDIAHCMIGSKRWHDYW